MKWIHLGCNLYLMDPENLTRASMLALKVDEKLFIIDFSDEWAKDKSHPLENSKIIEFRPDIEKFILLSHLHVDHWNALQEADFPVHANINEPDNTEFCPAVEDYFNPSYLNDEYKRHDVFFDDPRIVNLPNFSLKKEYINSFEVLLNTEELKKKIKYVKTKGHTCYDCIFIIENEDEDEKIVVMHIGDYYPIGFALSDPRGSDYFLFLETLEEIKNRLKEIRNKFTKNTKFFLIWSHRSPFTTEIITKGTLYIEDIDEAILTIRLAPYELNKLRLEVNQLININKGIQQKLYIIAGIVIYESFKRKAQANKPDDN